MKTIKINLIVIAYFVIISIVAIIATSCGSSHATCDAYSSVKWENSINNPENGEFITEVAFNLGIENSQVTQAQFDERYSEGY
jgi:hypothetical protein